MFAEEVVGMAERLEVDGEGEYKKLGKIVWGNFVGVSVFLWFSG